MCCSMVTEEEEEQSSAEISSNSGWVLASWVMIGLAVSGTLISYLVYLVVLVGGRIKPRSGYQEI